MCRRHFLYYAIAIGLQFQFQMGDYWEEFISTCIYIAHLTKMFLLTFIVLTTPRRNRTFALAKE